MHEESNKEYNNKIRNLQEFKMFFRTLQESVISMQAEAKKYPTYAAAREAMRLYGAEAVEEIRRQAPRARYVASTEQWKEEFHRQILPGEKAIQIKRTFWQDQTIEQKERDSAGNPILGADGQPVRASVTQWVQKEVVVPLYDVSQTKGEPFPPSIQNVHSYPVKDYEDITRALQKVSRQPIDDITTRQEEPNREKHIRVDSDLRQRPTVYMVLLEMALLDVTDHDMRRGYTNPKSVTKGGRATIVSTAVAYMTCKHLGIEAIDFAAPALAERCSNHAPELTVNYKSIYACFSSLTKRIDAELAEIHKEKGLTAGQKMVQRQGDAPEQTKVSIKEQLAAAQAKVEQNRGSDAANLVKKDKAEER